MLVIGGFDPTLAEVFDASDPWTYGLGVLDLTALVWLDGYNASAAEYEQSHLVRDFYDTK